MLDGIVGLLFLTLMLRVSVKHILEGGDLDD